MGQAKQRGTYEERVAQAKARDEVLIEACYQRWKEAETLKKEQAKTTRGFAGPLHYSPSAMAAIAVACGGLR